MANHPTSPYKARIRPRKLLLSSNAGTQAPAAQSSTTLQLADMLGIVKSAALEAMKCAAGGWFESDLTVRVEGRGVPFRIEHPGFKQLDTTVFPQALHVAATKLSGRPGAGRPFGIVENAVGAAVALGAGYYNLMPWDQWRHSQLIRAAIEGGCGRLDVAEDDFAIAAACVVFFERSVVSHHLTQIEQAQFVSGLRYDKLLNYPASNLLSCLYDRVLSCVFPAAWKETMSFHPIATDPVADVLFPEVLKLLFDGRVVTRDGVSRLRGGTRVPSSIEWRDRAYQLAKLLAPYLRNDAERSQQPNPQMGGRSAPAGQTPSPSLGEFDPQAGNHPFDSGPASDSYSGPLAPEADASVCGQGGEAMSPGRPGVTPVLRRFEDIDTYYKSVANAISIQPCEQGNRPDRLPENLCVGHLSFEEAHFSDLLAGNIDWFRTRKCPVGPRTPIGLQLFRRAEELVIPVRADDEDHRDLPSLLLICDSSGSIKYNIVGGVPAGGYDLVLRATWGIFREIEASSGTKAVRLCAINFSNNTNSSGWRGLSQITLVKRTLAVYQGGGTTLDISRLAEALQGRPDQTIIVMITDGMLSNSAQVLERFRSAGSLRGNMWLLHIGKPNAFTQGMDALGVEVKVLNKADDLVGLCLDIAHRHYHVNSNSGERT